MGDMHTYSEVSIMQNWYSFVRQKTELGSLYMEKKNEKSWQVPIPADTSSVCKKTVQIALLHLSLTNEIWIVGTVENVGEQAPRLLLCLLWTSYCMTNKENKHTLSSLIIQTISIIISCRFWWWDSQFPVKIFHLINNYQGYYGLDSSARYIIR